MNASTASALILLLVAAGAARADESADRPLRLIGSLQGKGAVARSFVIDGWVKPGDGDNQTSVEGWFSGLEDDPPHGAVQGSCVESHCALTVSTSDGKLSFTGELLDPKAPAPARFTAKDEDDKVVAQGTATIGPLTGPVPGLGALAAPDAVRAPEFDQLLVWNHLSAPSGSVSDEPIGDSERDSLADWQKTQNRPGTGLLFAADLAGLRAGAAAARKAAGWTDLGDKAHGWAGGYPAALLPRAERRAGEQRFASADGKATLAYAVGAPMTDAAFDALVERETGDHPERSDVGYNRVNGDMDLHYQQAGVVHVQAWHNHEGGLARMEFLYPAAAADTYDQIGAIIASTFVVSDDVKP
ncbi:hypothetical protein ACO2Q3_13925 [Caulobacter sp. KR2-114]|uniref:hypothetical protein n=1 Tax=Caulobacter sp. KR2-114 TaxID=3400912 RepID=UPI003C089103